MSQITTANLRVREFMPLMTPTQIREEYPNPPTIQEKIKSYRQQIKAALAGEDDRLLVITGPCSIHDPQAGLAYAERLAKLRDEVADRFLIIMRVYFEKPRTTVGWKGYINDPHLDGSEDIPLGLRRARELLIAINQLDMPCATEFLDPIVPQYTSDLISWAAIGARTTESQTHREMASGLSMPVGFKNATDGSLQIAVNAMTSAQAEHAFLGIDPEGRTSVVKTTGNPDVHIILRGGNQAPNYQPKYVAQAKKLLSKQAPNRSIMIDCSHGNSGKDYRRQPEVFQNVVQQYRQGEKALLGLMLESFLVDGSQKIGDPELVYGKSVTDGCIDWQTTENLIRQAYQQLKS